MKGLIQGLGIKKDQLKALKYAIKGKLYCFECGTVNKLDKEGAKKNKVQNCTKCGEKLFDLQEAQEYKKQLEET